MATPKIYYHDLNGKSHAHTADSRLCEIELSLPSQLRKDGGNAGVLAEVWLKLRREHISTNNGYRHLQYAFKAATLYIECEDCRIDGLTRHQNVVYTLKEVRGVDGATEFKVDSHGELGLNVDRLIKFVTAKVGVRAELRSEMRQTRQVAGELVQDIRSYWPAGPDSWALVGVKDERGIITDQIVGPAPICEILEEGPKARIRARLVVDLRDIWVDIDDSVEGGPPPVDRLEVSDNKKAVCALLVTDSFRKDADPLHCVGEIELARATVRRGPADAADD